MLVATTDYDKQELKNAKWTIGHVGAQTEGEILSRCIVEHNRRQEFTKSCKLLQIESNVEP